MLDIMNVILDLSEFGKLWLSVLFFYCLVVGFVFVVVVSDGV